MCGKLGLDPWTVQVRKKISGSESASDCNCSPLTTAS